MTTPPTCAVMPVKRAAARAAHGPGNTARGTLRTWTIGRCMLTWRWARLVASLSLA